MNKNKFPDSLFYILVVAFIVSFWFVQKLYNEQRITIVEENGKYGLKKGFHKIVSASYDYISLLNSSTNLFVCKVDNKLGVIDSNGDFKIQLQNKFDSIHLEPKFGILMTLEGENCTSVYDTSGELLIDAGGVSNISFIYDINQTKTSLLKIETNPGKLYGLYNIESKHSLPRIYLKIGDTIHCDRLAIEAQNKKFGFVDYSGEKIIDTIYYPTYYSDEPIFENDRCFLKHEPNGLIGIIDKNNNIISEGFIYNSIQKSSNGILIAKREYEYGSLWYLFGKDEYGRELSYDDISSFQEGKAFVENNNKLWGVIDEEGNEILPCEYMKDDNFKYEFENGKACGLKKIDEKDFHCIDSIGNYVK